MMMTTTMRLLLCSRWFFSSEGLYDDDECESWFTLVRFQPKPRKRRWVVGGPWTGRLLRAVLTDCDRTVPSRGELCVA
uniref:Putative secreted protein n=1 Tax=Anopheles triannulatus TaxID=58253 RepID=A0A2M4B4C7_9DIPT